MSIFFEASAFNLVSKGPCIFAQGKCTCQLLTSASLGKRNAHVWFVWKRQVTCEDKRIVLFKAWLFGRLPSFTLRNHVFERGQAKSTIVRAIFLYDWHRDVWSAKKMVRYERECASMPNHTTWLCPLTTTSGGPHASIDPALLFLRVRCQWYQGSCSFRYVRYVVLHAARRHA